MADRKEGNHQLGLDTRTTILWNFYKDHLDQARHHEMLREGLTAFVALAVGAIIAGFVQSKGGTLSWLDIVVMFVSAFATFGLGVLGLLASIKHFEISCRQLELAYAYRDAISAIAAGVPIDECRYDITSAPPEKGISCNLDVIDIADKELKQAVFDQPDGLHLYALRQHGEAYHTRKWDTRFAARNGYLSEWIMERLVKSVTKMRLYTPWNMVHIIVIGVGLILSFTTVAAFFSVIFTPPN